MKLILCKSCGDIYSLSTSKEKSCSCGKTKGMYTDSLNAYYSGDDAVPLGFANNSFNNAINNVPSKDFGRGKEFTAFVIPNQCSTFKKI